MRKKGTVLLIFFILTFVLAFHYLNILKPLENGLRSFINGSSSAVYKSALGIKAFFGQFAQTKKLRADYQNLQLDYQNILVDSIQFSLLKEENSQLREQLSFFSNNVFSHVGAEIISKTIDPIGNSVIINRGSEDSISEGDPVIVGKGILIGKIINVETRTAMVRLISDSQSRIAASVLNRESSVGVVEGGYGISVRMNFIPQNEHISPGDMVISSGLEPSVPHGLLIGSIEVVERKPHEPFQEAAIRTAYHQNLNRLVSVITDLP